MKGFKQRFLIVLCTMSAAAASAQQTGTVSGKILDDAGEPLAGAFVLVTGTDRGETSASDGSFRVKADPVETLSVSFLGYETAVEAVGTRSYIEVRMQKSAQFIDELVVVGYGVQKRANVTGAVATVDYAKESASRPVSTAAQVLTGLNAGLMVSQTSGQPGVEGMSLRIRGLGTLNDSAPLLIVDGFETSMANVNPDDIATVSVLKDAASCAIYGNRGANGVILITTKGGGPTGKFNVQYSGMVAFNRPASKFDIIDNYADYMDLINESAENLGTVARPFSQATIDLWREKERDPNGIADSGYPNRVAYPNVNWIDALFENNVYQKHSLSASGSTGGTSYMISMSYMDNPGIIMKTGQQKFQLRGNVQSQITKWLELGTKIWGYEGIRDVSDLSGVSSYMSRAVPGIYPYYDGKYGWMETGEQNTNSRNNLYFLDRQEGAVKDHYVNATAFANIKLPLNIKYHASFNYARHGTDSKSYGRTLDAFSFSKGDWAYYYNDLSRLNMNVSHRQQVRWTFQTNLSWDYTFAGKHDVTALAGFESMNFNNSSTSVQKTGFMNDVLTELSAVTNMGSIEGSQNDYATASVFGRVTYAYDSRYLLEVNMRYDGSSRFARRTRWGFFPSVSAGWRVSEEAFMENSGIDNLKLRASWGQLGNHSMGNYEWQSTYGTDYHYSFGGKQTGGMVSTLSNDLLEWETTTQTDIGLELAVLKNRLTFEADYYNRVAGGVLYAPPVYATIGSKSPPTQNMCEVTNNGIEFTVGWQDRVKDFRYGVSANFTRNYNRVSKFNGPLQAGWVTDENGFRSYQTNLGDVSETIGTTRRRMEGKMIDEFYLLDVYSGNGNGFFADGSVNPAGGPRDGMIRTEDDMAWIQAMAAAGNVFLPNRSIAKNGVWYGDYIYADTNGDGVYGDENDYTFQNVSMSPKFYYGFRFDMAWKGIDFSMTWAGAGGFSIYWRYLGFNAYSTRGDTTIAKDIAYDHYFYDPANPEDPRTNLTSKHGRLTMNYGSEQNGGTNYSTHWLYKGDYLKLKNLSIGYTLPKKWTGKIHLKDVRIFLSGENLFTFTKYPGMDPELTDTMNYYTNMKQYSVGLNIKF